VGRGERSAGRMEDADDSFAINCAFACADKPKRWRPLSKYYSAATLSGSAGDRAPSVTS
jgi:hypothetical protein